MNIYIYKRYNDEMVYSEEKITVFPSKDEAKGLLKQEVEEDFKAKWEEIPAKYGLTNLDTFKPDYVSIDGEHGTSFYIIEEHELTEANNPGDPEIQGMLTLNSCHIKETTAKFLDEESNSLKPELVVYACPYNWHIYIPEDSELLPECLPDDLNACIRYAQLNDCEWLCIDRDGPESSFLPTYEW